MRYNSKTGISRDDFFSRLAKGEKWCSTCKAWKRVDGFGSDTSRYDGFNSRCRECEKNRDRTAWRKRYQAKNRDRLNAVARAWRAKNPDQAKKIDSKAYHSNKNKPENKARIRRYSLKHRGDKIQYGREYRVLKWVRVLLNRLRKRSLALGLPFDLTADDVVVPEICPALGIPLRVGGFDDSTASVDRLDPTKGYVKGNVCIISMKANRIKNNATISEVEGVIAYMKRMMPDGL